MVRTQAAFHSALLMCVSWSQKPMQSASDSPPPPGVLGADSLGLGYWQKTRLIILPQAMKLVIPGIVNTFIGLFKDTSLVYIIGLFDLLGVVRLNFSDAVWASAQTPMTGLVFAGFVFWIFCFGMSRYSIYMERRLDTAHKR